MAVREVWAQCRLGQASFRAMRNGVARGSTDEVFSSMHAFLSHTANVSKVLRAHEEPGPLASHANTFRWLRRVLKWIDRKRPRRTIGEMLGVDTTSIIHREARRFRNSLEHYDEGLLRWLRKSGAQVNIADFNIMPKTAIQGLARPIFVRNLDPQTNVFTLADRDLALEPVLDELTQIQGVAQTWIDANV
jgi:hypothetical protein